MVQGRLAEARGDLDGAIASYRSALRRFQAAGDNPGELSARRALANLGIVRAQLGDYPAAPATLQDALARATELRYAIAQARALEGIGLVHSYQGEFSLGEAYLLQAWEAGQGIPLRAVCVAAGLCNPYRRWGRPDAALAWGARAADLCEQVQLPYRVVDTLSEYALALLAAGHSAQARQVLEEAERIAGTPGYSGDRLILDLGWVRYFGPDQSPAAAAAWRRWQAHAADPANAAWLATEAA